MLTVIGVTTTSNVESNECSWSEVAHVHIIMLLIDHIRTSHICYCMYYNVPLCDILLLTMKGAEAVVARGLSIRVGDT